MYVRLESVAPDLVGKVSRLPPDEQLRLRRVVVSHAIEATQLGSDPRIIRGLSDLTAGSFGDSGTRAVLVSLVDATDEQAWTLQELDAPDGSSAYLERFKQARAISSLAFALVDASAFSTLECIYEAQAAIGSVAWVRTVIAGEAEED